MRQHDLSEADAMTAVIRQFLNLEMKFPSEVIQAQTISKVFPPASRATGGWDLLYAEFDRSLFEDIILQHARFLLPGKRISIYVPHTLYARFSAINHSAHSQDWIIWHLRR